MINDTSDFLTRGTDDANALAQQPVNEWQPIETADKQRKSEEDHVDILLWDGIRQAVGYWDDTSYSTEEFVKETKSGKRVYQMVEYVSGYWHVEGDFLSPTHWMSLPKPPRAEQKGQNHE